MLSLKPTRNKILVTPYRRDKKWGGKIELLEKQRDVLMGDDHCFWVVAVPDGCEEIKVKDRVILIQDHDGLEYLVDGTKRAFVNLAQVLVVLPHEGFQTPP
jgi:hypothetical protein